MRPKGKRSNTIPVPMGGQFSAGDPSSLPDGTVSVLRNYMIRPNRFDGRAPFVWDSLDNVEGFAVWQDLTNELQKTVALNSTDNKLYTKNTNGVGYTAGVAGLTASTRLTGWTNFLGKLWMAFDDGAGTPKAMASWDGTTIVTAPFNSTINARDITAFIDRNFLIDPRVTVTPVLGAVAGTPTISTIYDITSTSDWNPTNITTKNATSGATTTCRLYPTSTTASSVIWKRVGGTTTGSFGFVGLAASTSPQLIVWRSNMRCQGTFSMPVTLEFVLMIFWDNGGGAGHVWTAGDVISDGVSVSLRCTTSGTGGTGAAPTWNTTVGATTADGTAVFTCEGSDVVASLETYLSPATAESLPDVMFLQGAIRPHTNSIGISPRFKFFNTATPTITLAAVEVSYKDGLADGDPRKANWGQQLTVGDFFYPFVNTETATSSAQNIDAVIWSEISNPASIKAASTYPLTEIAGLGTASIVSNGKLVVFKRHGMWIFAGQADVNEPILPESPAIATGCLGPMALDNAHDGTLYWLGTHHAYQMHIGAYSSTDLGTSSLPQEIDSPGIYEEIFARGANWVESQATYNLPILAIDHANKDVWIYTQKGKIYIYSIQSKLWSYLDTNPTGTSAEVSAMVFDPVSNRMLVSFGGQGATRFDETSNAQDTIIAGGGTAWNIQRDLVPKPFELFAARYEASLLEVGLFHNATIQNGSLTLSYSYDRGATYTTPPGYPVTSFIGNPRIRLPLAATGESVTIKISWTGAGGARNCSISKADAFLRVHRGELARTNAT